MRLVNKTGYLKGAKTAKNPVNVIPSNLITTQGMAFPIKANGKTLYPNTGQYKFPTPYVVETPLKQDGSEELKASEAAKFTYRIKDKKRRDTQVADMYNNTLDSFRGDTIGAKRHFKDFFTHYGSERFDGVRPLEGYYGFDRKDYDDKILDSLGRDWHKQMRVPKKDEGTKKTKTFNFKPNVSLAGDNTSNVQGQESAKATKFKVQQAKDYKAAVSEVGTPKMGQAEDKFRARYGISTHRFRYDNDAKYRQQVDNKIKEDEKAGKATLRENVKLDPNAMFMLPTGLKGQAAKDYQDFHKGIIGSALPIPGVPKFLRQGKNTSKVDFSKYLTPKEAASARAKRMLAQEHKWKVNNPSYVKDKFANIDNNFEEILAEEAMKKPSSLGVNSAGKAYSFKDAPLTEANRARIAAHETGHFYRNAGDEADEWNSFFDFSKLPHSTKKYLKGKSTATYASDGNSVSQGISINKRGVPHGDEIRERAAQLKDHIAQKNNIPLDQDFTITKSQLNDAIKTYVKDTKLDNTMTSMLSSLKDKKGFLNAMNKYALGVIPAVGASGVALQKKQGGTKSAKAFNLAFAKARKAGEKTFTLNGKSFTTDLKEDSKKNKAKSEVDYNDGRKFNLPEKTRKRIYNSVNPDGYPWQEIIPALGRYALKDTVENFESGDVTQADKDAWAFYMGVPQKEKTITRSKYTPTQAKTKTKYYTIRNAYPAFEDSVISNATRAFNTKKSFGKKISDIFYGNKDTPTKRTGVESSFRPLQNVTYSRGKDKKGHYYSLYDTYDFDLSGEKKIGNPYEIYDRVYYDSTTGKPLSVKKQGSKDMKPLIKYKDGSKSVSLAFSRGEKDPKGGLTQKGVDKYNRATGGNLKMAVTTPPSKLKPGSKAANRRKSFCARMSGVKGPMEKNGKPTRKALALRKWNC